jgi:ferrous iron transport protein A
MSTVAGRLTAPLAGDVLAETGPAAVLADLRPGMTATVTDIDASLEAGTARRLNDLGFAPGGLVTVVRRAPLGDPVVFRVADYEVALRRVQAAGIHVQITAPPTA